MHLMWMFSVLVCVLVIVWTAYRVANRRVLSMCRAIPSAHPCHPIFGHINLFSWSLDKMAEKGLQILQESVLHQGHRSVCFWIGPFPLIICVTDPDDIKKVLNNSLSRGKEFEDSIKDVMKYGLLTSPVDHWKVTRRQLNLIFRPRNLEQLMPTINSTSRQLVLDLTETFDGTVVNLMPHVMSAALRAICIFLYGPDTLDYISTEHFNDLKHAVELGAEFAALRFLKPWLRIEILFKVLYGKKINFINTALRRILQVAETKPDKDLVTDLDDNSNIGNGNSQNYFKTILHAMRELQTRVSSVTDERINDEMNSFFAAGTDTIGVTVSSCLLALASFPHIQDKVYKEIRSVLSEDVEDDITHLDLKRLTYLEQVVKETLRFFTVIPFTARAPTKDIDLGGYTIPANKTTGIWVTSVCFDPSYFHDPYNFDPDRFATPNSADDVFIPFSRGPRNCIGKEYAMMLIKVMVTQVVRKYRLSTNMDIQNLKRKFTVTLFCHEGYNVFLSKRSM